jgi:long-chain acyl-CoA synthetase
MTNDIILVFLRILASGRYIISMLFEPLLNHAARTPTDIAMLDESGTHTFEQLAASAAGMAVHLAQTTQRPSVGLMLPAGAGFAASFYGTLLAGKSVVPINFLLSEREMAHMIADSGIDTIVTIPQLRGKIKDDGVKVVDLAELAGRAAGAAPGELLAAFQKRLPAPRPDDIAVLMYTSGTSGLPKGVELTFGNLQSDVDACIEHAQLQHKHKFLGVIPLFHSFGMTAMMLAPVQLGSTVIYMARFSAVGAVNAVREHGVSLMFAVPSMLAAIAHLKSAVAEDFKTIYAMITGGEPLPARLREIFQQRFGLTLLEGYGLTETSPVVALNMPWVHRAGSVGKPVPGAEIKIADESGDPLPRGQTGEVWLRGPMVMKGYHNLPKETEAALTADGFFKTGDLGMVDAEGFLYITGRKKDLIIVAGEKVAPREVEEILVSHAGVAEAAVVGKQDAGRGEMVVAFVIRRPGEEASAEALRDLCRDQGLAQWKIPREFYFPPDLPRSPTGKVLKRLLAEQVNRAE